MNFYVASKTNDWHLARALMQELRAKGHTITYDWTETVKEVGPDACTTNQVTEEFRRECAVNDRKGVLNCDVLIAVHGTPGAAGMLIETGMALALDKAVWVLYEPERDSVFYALSRVTKFNDTYELFDHLDNLLYFRARKK